MPIKRVSSIETGYFSERNERTNYHGLDFFSIVISLTFRLNPYFKKYKVSKAQAVWHLIVN